jgi:Uma2 family endonuclease
MIGPADICIEVVSLESVERDYGKKFAEYETGGVKEYWIIDPIRAECRICRLSAEGRYQTQTVDADGNYTTPLLPAFHLHIPTLWQDQLPDSYTIGEAVRGMLAK